MARSTGGIRVQVEGMDRLRGRLEDLEPDLIAACKRAIEASAEAVRDDTEAAVRVDEGHLRQTVRIRYVDGGLTARVGWSDPTSYYAAFHEFGTTRFPAQPALHPALEGERARFTARIRDEVRAAIR